MSSLLKAFVILIIANSWLSSAAEARCLVQSDVELYDARLSTKEAWAHCSLGDAEFFSSQMDSALRGYQTLRDLKNVTPEQHLLFEAREAQMRINQIIMKQSLLPATEGGEAKLGLLNIESDYVDVANGRGFSMSGFGSLIAEVPRLPDNRITPLNERTRYYILTAAHLAQGENLRARDNLGELLELGRIYLNDESDLAVIEVIRDPLIQPLAYFDRSGSSQKLATYFVDINFASQSTTDRFSGYNYPISVVGTGTDMRSYRFPGFFLGHFEASEDRRAVSYPLLQRSKNGEVKINRSIRAGLSGSPIFSDIGSRYLSLTGVATYSGVSHSTAAGLKQILSLLAEAVSGRPTRSNGRWVFVNGVAVHQMRNETRVFFGEKPIGNGIYVNGKKSPLTASKLEPSLKLKLDTQLESLKIKVPPTVMKPVTTLLPAPVAPVTNAQIIELLRADGVNAIEN